MKYIIITCMSLLVAISACTDKTKKALDLKMEGINKVNISQYDEAIELFNESLKYNDKDPETYYYIGNAWFGKNNRDKAFEFYNKTIEIDSTFAPAYVNRGKIFSMRNDRDNACKDWLKAESLGVTNLREETKFCK